MNNRIDDVEVAHEMAIQGDALWPEFVAMRSEWEAHVKAATHLLENFGIRCRCGCVDSLG